MKRPQGFDSGPPPSGTTPAAKKPTTAGSATAKPVVAKLAAKKPATVKPATAKLAATRPDRAARRQLTRASSDRRRYERGEARRFTRRSRRRKVTWLVSLITLGVLVGAVTGAVFSPLLSLKTITVEGAAKVSAASIREAVSAQIGTPLALVDSKRIAAELAKFPLIRSFVTETLPPDTLVIRISERAPVASLATATGFSVVDPAGVVLQQSTDRTAGLPLLDLGTSAISSPAFTAAVGVLLALPASLAPRVDKISAHTGDDVTLTLSGGKTVVWGSSEQTDLKARVLAAMVAAPASESAARYDVSAPMHPVFAST